MKKCYFILSCLLLLLPALMPAQTATLLERLMAADELNYEQAAGFVLEAADLPDYYPTTQAAAFRYAADNKWVPVNASATDKANLEGVSLLVMQSFGFKGGLFYTLAKSPHYAYRELVYKEIIQGRTDPKMAVSGDLLLFMVGRALSLTEE